MRESFINEEKGSAYLWAVIVILMLCMLTVVVYNIIFIYTNFNNAKNELERAAVVTVNGSLENENVRDLIFDIPKENATALFYDNLQNAGYILNGNSYIKTEDGKEKYRIENIELEFEGELMEIKATIAIPLIWQMEDITTIDIPVKLLSRVYYIDY